ncbi:hypothetical protein C5167_007533 [Papaver somniferum]|nr:hypothetical protein C5167_007533 [Papaver somniferum]
MTQLFSIPYCWDVNVMANVDCVMLFIWIVGIYLDDTRTDGLSRGVSDVIYEFSTRATLDRHMDVDKIPISAL